MMHSMILGYLANLCNRNLEFIAEILSRYCYFGTMRIQLSCSKICDFELPLPLHIRSWSGEELVYWLSVLIEEKNIHPTVPVPFAHRIGINDKMVAPWKVCCLAWRRCFDLGFKDCSHQIIYSIAIQIQVRLEQRMGSRTINWLGPHREHWFHSHRIGKVISPKI